MAPANKFTVLFNNVITSQKTLDLTSLAKTLQEEFVVLNKDIEPTDKSDEPDYEKKP